MTIGNLAKLAQVNVQTVRYYERIGILKPDLRKESGYRVYSDDSLRRLSFIKHGQDLGFTLEEIGELLTLSAATPAGRKKARERATQRIAAIREKIAYLKKLERSLKKMVQVCQHRSMSSPCPILEEME